MKSLWRRQELEDNMSNESGSMGQDTSHGGTIRVGKKDAEAAEVVLGLNIPV